MNYKYNNKGNFSSEKNLQLLNEASLEEEQQIDFIIDENKW